RGGRGGPGRGGRPRSVPLFSPPSPPLSREVGRGGKFAGTAPPRAPAVEISIGHASREFLSPGARRIGRSGLEDDNRGRTERQGKAGGYICPGAPGKDFGADGRAQPFTAPAVRPRTTYRCVITARISTGSVMMTAAAMRPPQSI